MGVLVGHKGNRRAFPARLLMGRLGAMGCWVLLLASLTAQAGVLYRCAGSQGEVVFSSSKADYRACRQMMTSQRSSLATVTAEAATAVKPLASAVVSLERVAAAVTTTARAVPSPLAGKRRLWTYSESRHEGSSPRTDAVSDDQVLRGAVYRVVHHDSSVEYTNIPPREAPTSHIIKLFSYIATCMACNLHSTIHWSTVALHLDAYQGAIHEASLESGVDEALIRAIIHSESGFNPRAISLKGAQGLMQLMPGTASDMGVLDAFDPAQNIRGGARYLGLLMKHFNGDVRLAAAAYNAGPYAVQHYNGVPPFAETQVYVRRVGALLQRYGKALHPPLASF